MSMFMILWVTVILVAFMPVLVQLFTYRQGYESWVRQRTMELLGGDTPQQ